MTMRRASVSSLRLLVVAAAIAWVFGASSQAAADVTDPADDPNILVILTDDQEASAETLSKMPYLGTQATGWFRFSNAFVNNPTCCPARATFLSGEWSHHTGIETPEGSPPFCDEADSIAATLRAHGYTTAWIGKYHLGKCGGGGGFDYVPPGWDHFVELETQGDAEHPVNPYYDYTLNDNGTVVEFGDDRRDYSTDVTGAETWRFIDEQLTADRPFFAVWAPRAPHNNWEEVPRWAGIYNAEAVSQPPSWNDANVGKPAWWPSRPSVTFGNRQSSMRDYWNSLLGVDDWVRYFHLKLVDRGAMANTVIVFTSDNGYAFGDYRHSGKQCVYDVCSKVPLLIKYGTDSTGTVFAQTIGNEDLAPTFAAIAGATEDPLADLDGESFESLLRTKTTPPGWDDYALIHAANPGNAAGDPPDAWAIRTPTHLYAETPDPVGGPGEGPGASALELYDMTIDPYQLTNEIDDPAYDAVQASLAAQMDGLGVPSAD